MKHDLLNIFNRRRLARSCRAKIRKLSGDYRGLDECWRVSSEPLYIGDSQRDAVAAYIRDNLGLDRA